MFGGNKTKPKKGLFPSKVLVNSSNIAPAPILNPQQAAPSLLNAPTTPVSGVTIAPPVRVTGNEPTIPTLAANPQETETFKRYDQRYRPSPASQQRPLSDEQSAMRQALRALMAQKESMSGQS